MKLAFIHVCDYASVSVDGKLSVMGIFSNLNAVALPTLHPMMYLAFGIEVSKAEVGRDLKVEIHLVDTDGGKLLSAEAVLKVEQQGAPARGGRPVLPQVIGMAGTRFNREGEHSFNVFLNGNHAGEATFTVAVLKQPPSGLRQ